LTNTVKHAQASQVWVDLSVEDDRVNLTVQDNGLGFSEREPQSNGIGLTGLRERITIAGGTLNINSRLKHGTILSAQLPLSTNIKTTGMK
jgi:signal transduction histidine kinase